MRKPNIAHHISPLLLIFACWACSPPHQENSFEKQGGITCETPDGKYIIFKYGHDHKNKIICTIQNMRTGRQFKNVEVNGDSIKGKGAPIIDLKDIDFSYVEGIEPDDPVEITDVVAVDPERINQKSDVATIDLN